MNFLLKLSILLLSIGTAATASRNLPRRLKGDKGSSNPEMPTWAPTIKPTKEGTKAGKEKGADSSPNSDELPTAAPNYMDSKGDAEGKKEDGPLSSPTGVPIPFDSSQSLTLPPTVSTGKDTKAPSDGKANKDDSKEPSPPSPTKSPKAPETGPKGAPKEPETLEDSESEPKGTPKGSDTATEAPKGAPKGSDNTDGIGIEQKGTPKGSVNDIETESKGDAKGAKDAASSNGVALTTKTSPGKDASPPVEVHMIGVKLGSGKPKTAAIAETDEECSSGTNMIAKKLAVSSPCAKDCEANVGTKKIGGNSNCSKFSKKGPKKRYI